MLYNPRMRKIPLLWFVLALVFSPPGGALAAAQAGRSGACPAHSAAGAGQQPGVEHHHQDRQAGHGCCGSHACGALSHAHCSDHCAASFPALLAGIHIALSAIPAAPIPYRVQSYPPHPIHLPDKPPRA